MVEQSEIGLTWTVEEPIARSSHALVFDHRVWLVDPTDEPSALEQALRLGEPAGVIQLVDRHNRDCARLAADLGVPHLRVPDEVPGTKLTVVRLIGMPFWREVALWWPATGTLVVAEAVGTSLIYAPAQGGAGIHPLLRLWPPRPLDYFAPQNLLVGHGPAVRGGAATDALQRALRRCRRDLPRAAAALVKAGMAQRS